MSLLFVRKVELSVRTDLGCYAYAQNSGSNYVNVVYYNCDHPIMGTRVLIEGVARGVAEFSVMTTGKVGIGGRV